MNFQALSGLIIAVVGYLVVEIILSMWKDVPTKFGQQVFGAVRRQWKERVYLRGILRDPRFAQWKPEVQRYVALRAIKAQKSDGASAPQPLLDLLHDHLKRREAVLVLGNPGAGKTTAMEALTYRLAHTAYRRSTLVWFAWLGVAALLLLWSPLAALVWLGGGLVVISRARWWVTPFFLELRAFFESKTRDFLAAAVKEVVGDETLLGGKGRCLFLLDGANEINRDHAARFLETWRQQNPPLAFFTSRTGEKPALEVPAVEVCELDDEGVKAFMGVYLQERQKENAGGERVEAEPDFAELGRKGLLAERGVGRNPYWLRMLVLSGLRTRNRGALFLSFARELLRREIEVKPEERKRKPDWAAVPLEVEMDALAELALAMNRERQVGFEGEANWGRARQILNAELEDRRETPDDVLGEAEAATLLRQRYKERVEFTHQLVQEFFAAYALRRENRWEEAIAHCEDSWWWETLFLLGGLTAIPEAGGSLQTWAGFTRQVLGVDRNNMRLFVAIGLLRSIEAPEATVSREVLEAFMASVGKGLTLEQQSAARELERVLGDEAIEIFWTMFRDPDTDIKTKGAALLCAVGSRRAMESLLTMLRDPEEQEAAFQVLASIGVLAVEPLITVLKSADGDGRAGATWALGQISDPRAIEPLITALKDADEGVRVRAAWALGQISDPRAVEPLIAALKDADGDVRAGAARALGQISDPRAVEPLSAALRDPDRIFSMREYTAEALGQIGDPRAVEPLIAILKDANEDMRRIVALSLGQIGQPAVEPLITALKDADGSVRAGAARALGQIGDARAVEPLIVALKDADKDARLRAAEALGTIGDAHAVEPLIVALNDVDEDVRRIVTISLGQIGDAYSLMSLIAIAVKNAIWETRWQAAEALGKISDARAIEPLIAALKDTDRDVPERAAEVLRRIGQPAVEPLITVLKSADGDGRAGAAWALGQIGDPRAVEPLITALKDADEGVRAGAAWALGQIGDPRAVEPLITVLKSADGDGRAGAALALGQIGDPRAVEPLIAALKDADGGVLMMVAASLGQIGDARAVEPLSTALKDADEGVRAGAALALGQIGDPRAVEPLIAALKDADGGVLMMVATSLGQIGQPAVEPLITALKDADGGVRERAAEALGKIGDARAVEPLIVALKDADKDARLRAAMALGKIGDARALAELKRIAREDRYVTDEAKKATKYILRRLGGS